jgi:outer membrane receptor protein involved in Fe transport
MIERIEVLKDGASSIYGSDAVAGVVNIITRNNIDGITIEGQFNAPTDADNEGQQTRMSIVAGTNGDRWRVAGSAEYYNRQEMTLGAREFARCAVDGYTDGSDFIDPMTGKPKCYTIDGGGVTINTIGTSAAAGVPGPGTSGSAFNRWRPNSAITTGLVGYEGVSTMSRDSFHPDMLKESLVSPAEIVTLYAEGGYDLQALGNAEVYGEVLYNSRRSSQAGYRQLSLDYYKGNLLIPSNLGFSTAALNGGLSPTSGAFANANVGVRAFVGAGLYESRQDVDFNKEVVGIRGDLFIPNWRYDAYASYTKSKAEYTTDLYLTDLLRNSLDVVVAPAGMDPSLTRRGVLSTGVTGTVTCRVNTVDPTVGCIPAPFLTSATVGGDLPQQWVDYVRRPVTGTTEYIEKVVSIGLDGPLFTLPAGQVSAFIGAEWRDASIDDTPGVDSQNSNTYSFSSSGITRGSDSVWEVFGEVEVPLLANLPLAQSLTFNASARYTDYESYGSDTTYKAGLVYTPVNWLTLRGTYGTSYRAPALFEQFVGATSGFYGGGVDPCSELDGTENPAVAANCGSEGLSDFVQLNGVTVVTSGGAQAGLAAETSTNMTVGAIFQPTLPSGWGDLSFAVDYYEIEIDNGVSRIGYGAILSRCYSSSAAEFAARSGYCALIERDPANRLTIFDSYVNVATDVVKGLDYTVRYRRDIGPGTALFNLGITQVTERYDTLFDTDPVYDDVGTIGTPEFSGTFDATYAWNNWRVRYGVEWIAATGYNEYYMERQGFDLAGNGYDVEVDDYYLHSASVQYRTDEFTVTVGVRNLFNTDPDSVTAGVVNRVGNAPLYSGYDYVGRAAFINLSKSF